MLQKDIKNEEYYNITSRNVDLEPNVKVVKKTFLTSSFKTSTYSR